MSMAVALCAFCSPGASSVQMAVCQCPSAGLGPAPPAVAARAEEPEPEQREGAGLGHGGLRVGLVDKRQGGVTGRARGEPEDVLLHVEGGIPRRKAGGRGIRRGPRHDIGDAHGIGRLRQEGVYDADDPGTPEDFDVALQLGGGDDKVRVRHGHGIGDHRIRGPPAGTIRKAALEPQTEMTRHGDARHIDGGGGGHIGGVQVVELMKPFVPTLNTVGPNERAQRRLAPLERGRMGGRSRTHEDGEANGSQP